MDIDRKVKIKVLFQNDSMREKICYCGCRITKLNKDEFTVIIKNVILVILNLMNILKN